MRLHESIRLMRKARGMKATDVSRMTGINKSTISQIENGRLNTTIDKAERIADALGCDVVLVPR